MNILTITWLLVAVQLSNQGKTFSIVFFLFSFCYCIDSIDIQTKNLIYYFKGALSGLWQFLAIESPLKVVKNAFYFTSKALFVLKISNFFSWLIGHVATQLD